MFCRAIDRFRAPKNMKANRAWFYAGKYPKPNFLFFHLNQKGLNQICPGTIPRGHKIEISSPYFGKDRILHWKYAEFENNYAAQVSVTHGRDKPEGVGALGFNKLFDERDYLDLKVVNVSEGLEILAKPILVYCLALAYSYGHKRIKFSGAKVLVGHFPNLKGEYTLEEFTKFLGADPVMLERVVLDYMQLRLDIDESDKDFPCPTNLIRMARIITGKNKAFRELVARQAQKPGPSVIVDIGSFKSAFLHVLMENNPGLKNSYFIGIDAGTVSHPSPCFYEQVDSKRAITSFITKTGLFNPGVENLFSASDWWGSGNTLYRNKKYPRVFVIRGNCQGLNGGQAEELNAGDYNNMQKLFRPEVLKRRFTMVCDRRMASYTNNLHLIRYLSKLTNSFYICDAATDEGQPLSGREALNVRGAPGAVGRDFKKTHWVMPNSSFLFAERFRG